jgi:hypothetical protein
VGEAFTSSTADYLSRRLVTPEPRAKAEAVAKADQLRELLANNLDLLVNHPSGEAIDCDINPITLLAFDDEFSQVRLARRVFSALRDHVEHQIPPPRSIDFVKRQRDRLTLRLYLK